MEHTTFAKKTVVLAALGALSLMAATVRAADETETEPAPEAKTIEVTIGAGASEGTVIGSTIDSANEKVEWNDAWLKEVLKDNETFGGLTFKEAGTITVNGEGSFSIDLPTKEETAAGNDGKYVTFNGVNLTVEKGGTFSNSSYVKFTEKGSLTVVGADFTNDKDGVIALEGTTFSLNAGEKDENAGEKDALGNFENAGLIILDSSATMDIGSSESAIHDVTSEDKFSLNVGNVEIKSGKLTNYDKGYQITKETKEEAEGEAGAEDAASVQTLVKFGQVTVADGGKFVNAEGALSAGSALVLEAVNTAEIDGTSVWGTLNLTKVEGAQTVTDYVKIAEKQEGKNGGDFRVTGALVIDEFVADTSGNASFTIYGKTNDAKVFADGIDISAGSHVAADAFEQINAGDGLSWKTNEEPVVGTLELTGFAATFEKATEEPEGEGKAESEGDETNTGGSWTYKKLGDVTAVNTKVEITGARPSPAQGSTDPYAGNGYTPSLQMSSLTLGGTSMKIAYDVDVEKIKEAVNAAWKGEDKIDVEGWTKDNILEQLDTLLKDEKYADLKTSLEADRDALEGKLAGSLKEAKDVGSTISESDLAIGTLTLALKNETVKVEKPFASAENDGENTTTQAEGDTETDTKPETVTITGDKTYDLGNLSLTVIDSRIDIDTLDLQTGSVTLDQNSIMMIGNVKTLNGDLTLKSGYLGLNVTTGVAEHLKPKDTQESKAESEEKSYTATVEVGSPITIGSNGQLSFGQNTATVKRADDAQTQTNSVAIGFYTDTNIVFDGKNFNSEALFSQDRADGEKGLVSVGDKGSINIQGQNLSWGVYKIFDSDTLDTTGLENVTITADGSSASGLWKGADVKVNGNEIVVGDKTIEGSGLDIGAVNLANSVVGGDRGSALDKVLFNHILSNGKSLDEISNTINSITAMGAVAGLTAMTVDFGAYVTDQVEHHAVTIPHQQEGWWVQGLAGKLKSDDLAVGGMKSGYSIDTFGIMGGFDRKLRNGDTIGVAASYQSGDADSEGNALPVSTDVTNYGLHLWHARQFDAYRLMGMFSYSKTSGDAKMNYVGNEITSDLGATEISIGARADKEFKWGTVRMIPHAGVRASMIDVDDYTIEMGSEELFKVSEDKLWIFEVPVGVTFASSFEYARWNVQPYVDLTVRGRFGDTDSTFTLEGSNTSDSMKYDVTGDVIGDLRIGYMSTFQDLNLGMSYGLSAGDGGRQNHQIEATLRIDFN